MGLAEAVGINLFRRYGSNIALANNYSIQLRLIIFCFSELIVFAMNNDVLGVYRESLPEAVSADLFTLNPQIADVNGHLKKNVRMPSKTTSTSFLQHPTE